MLCVCDGSAVAPVCLSELVPSSGPLGAPKAASARGAHLTRLLLLALAWRGLACVAGWGRHRAVASNSANLYLDYANTLAPNLWASLASS